MKQISAVLDILGYKAPELICYSFVLLEGGRMETSKGKVVLVTDFMKAVKETLIKEFESRNSEITEEMLENVRNKMQEIIDNIRDTVDIVTIIKPIYNYKACE